MRELNHITNDNMDKQMKVMLAKKRIDYDELKYKYLDGTGIDKIAMKYHITVEQLKWILENVLKITRREEEIRKRNIEKFNAIQIKFEVPDRRTTLKDNGEER